MLFMSLIGVINMSRQFSSTFVGMAYRSHGFDDEPKISFLMKSCVELQTTCILDLLSGFCTYGILQEMVTKYFYLIC